eukprot:Nitzschia sp. Nitz4//scaffold147_size54853//40061//42547//NITZ4_006625-RA/size54853-processed-gene-0.27-mRNA-1//-1//CDS//3329536717//677//frame0
MRHSITSISPNIENPSCKKTKKTCSAKEGAGKGAQPPTKRESWPRLQQKATNHVSTQQSRMSLSTRHASKRSSLRLSASITAIEDECDDPEMWFDAIHQHDWEMVDQLIAWFDHTKYRQAPANPGPNKSTKKLKILKCFTMMKKKKKDKEVMETYDSPVPASPLLETDEKGRTPLHLACGELMPFSTLQSLFFLERNAAHVKDGYGRFPLHWAALAGHEEEVIDRLVRANPAALKVPDKLKRTPLAHAIWHVGHRRDASHEGHTWRTPVRAEEAKWQGSQTEKWAVVSFLLDIFRKRKILITKKCEMQLVIDAIQFQAPPRVVGTLLTMAARVIPQASAALGNAVGFLFKNCYPLNLFELVCKACVGSPAQAPLQHIIRMGIMKHMQNGHEGFLRDSSNARTSFQEEMLEVYKLRHVESSLLLSRPCQEWWDKLKFFIGFCSTGSLKGHTLDERYLLHSSLFFPDTCLCLVKLLVGLFPNSLYVRDPETEQLPLHIACGRRYHNEARDGSMSCQVLRLVLGEDANLVNSQCWGRYPLHMALACDQHPSFLDILISLNPDIMTLRDPVTKLFPFQLAACGNQKITRPGKKKPTPKYTEAGHVDLVFRLLRGQPAVLEHFDTGSSAKSNKAPIGALNPAPCQGAGIVAQLVMGLCYQQEGDEHVLNTKNVRLLRKAIANGEVPAPLQGWVRHLKLRIWKSYDKHNAGKMIVHLPREDRYLLHAALSIPGVPPIVIELLLELFPKSVSIPAPGTDQYPIHLAAECKSTYKPRSFERPLSLGTPLELLAQALPASTQWIYKNQTPLQIATGAGKRGTELGPLKRMSRQRCEV